MQELSKIDQSVKSAFGLVRKDLETQKRWIEQMSREHASHKSSSHEHKQNTDQWISFLHKNNEKQSQDVDALKDVMEKALTSYNEHILDLHKKHAETVQVLDRLTQVMDQQPKAINHDDVKEFVKSQVKEHVEHHAAHLKRSLHDHAKVLRSREPDRGDMASPLRWLVSVLLDADKPLSYEELSGTTQKKINTLRVYMNQLKEKGFIDETVLPNGVKLFALRNIEKVKTLYNPPEQNTE